MSVVDPILFAVETFEMAAHVLTVEHKKRCVPLGKGFLMTIAAAPRGSWSRFITGDESWFDLSTDYEPI
jgi:hypothetical protein